jgi:hypothetical protein
VAEVLAMLIRWADDLHRDLDGLNGLLARPGLSAAARRRIQEETRTTKAGIAGESDAAYEINFYFGDSGKWAVIHGLRIEVGSRVAQIDHLLVNRFLDIWVCETKHFAEGIGLNEHGEWVGFRHGRPFGIASPIEQNRKHVAVLRQAFDLGLVQLPRRLGIGLLPAIESLVLVSGKAQIRRPEGRSASRINGLNSVIKVDQLRTTIDRQIETESAIKVLRSGTHFVTAKTLEDFAWRLAALHKPKEVDWASRFGLAGTAIDRKPEPLVVRCAMCERLVTAGVVDYCQDHRERFSGRILCWNCQRVGL